MEAVAEKIDVFLSYTSADRQVAAEIKERLGEADIVCFMAEKDIAAAAKWEPTILTALTQCDCVLLLITPRSKDRPWILLETGAAWALQKTIIPALMFVQASELVEPIRQHQVRSIESPKQFDSLVAEIPGILTNARQKQQSNIRGGSQRQLTDLLSRTPSSASDSEKANAWLAEALSFVHSLPLAKDRTLHGHAISTAELDIRDAMKVDGAVAVVVGILRGLQSYVQ